MGGYISWVGYLPRKELLYVHTRLVEAVGTLGMWDRLTGSSRRHAKLKILRPPKRHYYLSQLLKYQTKCSAYMYTYIPAFFCIDWPILIRDEVSRSSNRCALWRLYGHVFPEFLTQ